MSPIDFAMSMKQFCEEYLELKNPAVDEKEDENEKPNTENNGFLGSFTSLFSGKKKPADDTAQSKDEEQGQIVQGEVVEGEVVQGQVVQEPTSESKENGEQGSTPNPGSNQEQSAVGSDANAEEKASSAPAAEDNASSTPAVEANAEEKASSAPAAEDNASSTSAVEANAEEKASSTPAVEANAEEKASSTTEAKSETKPVDAQTAGANKRKTYTKKKIIVRSLKRKPRTKG
jgi:hypothetical protein